MPRSYSGSGASGSGTGPACILTVQSQTGVNVPPRIFEVSTCRQDAPHATDFNWVFRVARTTDNGSGSSGATANRLDGSSVASQTVFSTGHAVMPTLTDILLEVTLNQRDTLRWWCSGRKELRALSANNNGLALVMHSASQATASSATVMWNE